MAHLSSIRRDLVAPFMHYLHYPHPTSEVLIHHHIRLSSGLILFPGGMYQMTPEHFQCNSSDSEVVEYVKKNHEKLFPKTPLVCKVT